ncbi:restriction endonuclease subunit S [Deinococcus sp. NW-56]|uniref:restriction endonuclease subunit S n=1 Tax=Deinococcus sp. NW-56 TaxID=2080419 RepID=UPI0035140179
MPALIDWEAVPYCELTEKEQRKYLLKEGDIVVARTGATTGWAKRIKNPPEAVFASYLVRLQLRKGVDAGFVGAVVESAAYKEFIQKHMGGAAQPNANAQVLTSFPLKLPPLPTQRKIAAILSAYDDLIENNTRRVRVLEEMARALYREWFVEFRFPGHEAAEFVEDEQGRRPKGWEAKALGDIAFETRRAVDPANLDPETRYVGLEHIPRRLLALGDWGRAADVQSTKLKFDEWDILFGKIRPYFHKVSVAPVSGVCSSDAIVIKALRPEWWPLAVMTVSSDEFVAHSVQTSNGTKMPRANWSVLVKYRVNVPPAPLLERFNELIESVVKQGGALTLRNANLRRTRDLLLPRLVSGELDVSALNVRGPGLETEDEQTREEAVA